MSYFCAQNATFYFFLLTGVGQLSILRTNMSTKNKDKLSVTLPVELMDRVRARADREHRSVSGQVAYFLSIAVAQLDTDDDKEAIRAG